MISSEVGNVQSRSHKPTLIPIPPPAEHAQKSSHVSHPSPASPEPRAPWAQAHQCLTVASHFQMWKLSQLGSCGAELCYLLATQFHGVGECRQTCLVLTIVGRC